MTMKITSFSSFKIIKMKRLIAILSVVLFANQAGIEFMNGTT